MPSTQQVSSSVSWSPQGAIDNSTGLLVVDLKDGREFSWKKGSGIAWTPEGLVHRGTGLSISEYESLSNPELMEFYSSNVKPRHT
jgi:hypothetical protein